MNNVLPNSGRNTPGLMRKPVSGMLALLLIFVGATSGCASSLPLTVQTKPVVLEAPPPELMETEEENLRQRLQQLSGPSPQTGTEPSEN